jgi:serine/threonine-protein kinase RsbW
MTNTLTISQQENKLTLYFSSSFEGVDRAVKEALAFLKPKELKVDPFAIHLVLREGLTNAVEHGNQNNPARPVYCGVEVDTAYLAITIEDEGEGFNWQQVMNKEPEENSPCGRGLLLMQAYQFTVSYNEKGNVLYLRKHIQE